METLKEKTNAIHNIHMKERYDNNHNNSIAKQYRKLKLKTNRR